MDMEQQLAQLTAMAPFAIAPGFIVLGYFFILLDKREDRPSKDDKQVGSKLVVWAFILTGVLIALSGIDSLLSFILGGFKPTFKAIKLPLIPLVTGGAIAAAFALVFLPRTNNSTQPQVERFAMGALAFAAGIAACLGLQGLIQSLILGGKWAQISDALSLLVVGGGAAFFAFFRHGQLSGWTQPAPRPAAPMPPAGGGYPGGYPQQGGGYPPQGGGGYPPQGGGGYPPQGGGGYPPQGGGGYPPQGGGGYPPQGGGYGR